MIYGMVGPGLSENSNTENDVSVVLINSMSNNYLFLFFW